MSYKGFILSFEKGDLNKVGSHVMKSILKNECVLYSK